MWREWSSVWIPRRVSWLFDSALWRLNEQQQRSFVLTFDDGPHPHTTPRLLTLLERHHIRATFFLLGQHAKTYPELVRAIAHAGHVIGNHSYSHLDAWKTPAATMRLDLECCADLLSHQLGEHVCWMRPPFGHFNLPMIQWCRQHQQRMVMWDVIPPDYRSGATLLDLTRHADRWLRRGSIVCLHENETAASVTTRFLSEWLPRVIDAGWVARSLPEEERLAPSWRKAA